MNSVVLLKILVGFVALDIITFIITSFIKIFSSLDDKYIEQMNNAFAEQGIEAHFEKLKTFKGNIVQVLKMVDDFIADLEEKSGQIATK